MFGYGKDDDETPNEHYFDKLKVEKEKERYAEEYDVALLLIFTAERLLVRRKYFEATHGGLSTSFSDDPFVLLKMQEFLNDPRIRERIAELTKEMS